MIPALLSQADKPLFWKINDSLSSSLKTCSYFSHYYWTLPSIHSHLKPPFLNMNSHNPPLQKHTPSQSLAISLIWSFFSVVFNFRTTALYLFHLHCWCKPNLPHFFRFLSFWDITTPLQHYSIMGMHLNQAWMLWAFHPKYWKLPASRGTGTDPVH